MLKVNGSAMFDGEELALVCRRQDSLQVLLVLIGGAFAPVVPEAEDLVVQVEVRGRVLLYHVQLCYLPVFRLFGWT
jgi:hypothetical protein